MKALLSGHLRDLPKCPFNSGCPLNRGFYFQRLPCTMIKFRVVEETKDALQCTLCKTSSLIDSLLTAKCIDLSLLIDYSTYFKDVIH